MFAGVKRSHWPSLAVAGIAVILFGCFETQDPVKLEGPGSETVGLYGEASYASGKLAVHAQVIIRPLDYYQDTAELAPQIIPGGITETDKHGEYRLAPLPPETYAIEVLGDSGRAALIYGTVSAGKLTEALPAQLKPVGGLKGKVVRLRNSKASVFIRIAGMDRRLYLAPDSSHFQFSDLPEGRYTLQAMSSDPSLGKAWVREIEIQSSKVQDIGSVILDAFSQENYAEWRHSRALIIRAGKGGADITGDVLGFPLLVRMEGVDFPMDSAGPSKGNEIRFASASGKKLPYQIESWDASAKRASIWVKVDTIHGGNDMQEIRIHWGNTQAPDLSYGPSVFDSADGYRGIWHMDRQANDKPAAFLDASPLGNSLVTAFADAVTSVASPLTNAAQMDGIRGLLSSTVSMEAPQTFSVSIWFKGLNSGKLIGFQESFLSQTGAPYDRHIWVEPNGTVHFGVYIADPPASAISNERILVSDSGFLDGAWHQAVGIQSPTGGQHFYLDGKKVGSDSTVNHAEAISGYWIMGAGSLGAWSPVISDSHFKGALDEARVVHRVNSADWIKLDFMTQKSGALGLDGQSILRFRN